MASNTHVIGHTSERLVELALLSMGWEVSRPVVDEAYDLLAHEPGTPPNKFLRLQVKTIRRREDRNNEMVIYATNGRGAPYTIKDCDFLVGVEGNAFYFVPCRGLREYWATDTNAARNWTRFEINL